MDLWIYYETDGDSGWYGVKLFASKAIAEAYQIQKNTAYGHLDTINVNVEKPTTSAYTNDMLCPECEGPMVSRTNRQNGNKFWGCKKYPDCKGTRDEQGRSKAERDAERAKENKTYEQQDGFSFQKR
jgi:hypothetical protein